MDALYKMFVEGMVCVLKMNPVNEYLGPYLERALEPLIARGYLRIVYGGARGRAVPGRASRASTTSTSPARTAPTT